MGDAMKQFLWNWLPPLAWMGLIFVFSAQPDLPRAPGPWLDGLLKKMGHAAAYGSLAWLYYRALRPHFGAAAPLRVASVALALIYALTDEFHQTLVPGRNGNLVDVMVDGAGACGAMFLEAWLERRRVMPRRVPGAQ